LSELLHTLPGQQKEEEDEEVVVVVVVNKKEGRYRFSRNRIGMEEMA
jgi:hypothetical protein